MVAVDAIVVCFQSTPNFPSWFSELKQRVAGSCSERLPGERVGKQLVKRHENRWHPWETVRGSERRDRAASGEVETDKLVDPACAWLSEQVGVVVFAMNARQPETLTDVFMGTRSAPARRRRWLIELPELMCTRGCLPS